MQNILHFVADGGQVGLKSVLRDYHRAATVIGVKTEGFGIFETAIEEEYHMMFGVVNQSERAHATGFESEVLHHSFRRGERQFAGRVKSLRYQHILEPMFDVMNGQIVIAGEADEVVLIALVITHEDVFTMQASVVVPPSFGLFDGLAFGMVVGGEWNAVFR